MVLAKTGDGIISIRGRCGGVYFRKDPGGQHIQVMPRHIKYTRSALQIGSFGESSPFASSGSKGYTAGCLIWAMALVAFYVAVWAVFASIWLFQKVFKEPKKINGFNWYMHFALAYPESERPPYWKPPPSPKQFPDWISVYEGYWTYQHDPTTWPPDCCAGYYYTWTMWNGKPSYRTDDLNWFIWWKPPIWVVSRGLGNEAPLTTFYSEDDKIWGWYQNPVTEKMTQIFRG